MKQNKSRCRTTCLLRADALAERAIGWPSPPLLCLPGFSSPAPSALSSALIPGMLRLRFPHIHPPYSTFLAAAKHETRGPETSAAAAAVATSGDPRSQKAG